MSFSSCAALPDWVLNPPVSDTEIFAVGQGRTLQESEQAAIKNILGQLRTRIDSSLKISEQAVNDAFKATIEQSVNSSVENFPISQYQILNRHQDGDVIYTQAKASKSNLSSAMSAEVQANRRKIDNAFSMRETGGSPLEWWVNNKETVVASHAANTRYVQILNLLGNTNSGLNQLVESDQQRIINVAKDTCLYVNPTQHSKLQQAVRKQVINFGLPADRKNCPYKLDIQTSNQEGQLFGKFTSSLTMTATLTQQNTALASTEVVQTGQSVSGQNMANKASLSLLVKRLENKESTLINELLAN